MHDSIAMVAHKAQEEQAKAYCQTLIAKNEECAPTAMFTPTTTVSSDKLPQEKRTWWIPSTVEGVARGILGSLPDTDLIDDRKETPLFGFMTSNGMLSFGHVTETIMGAKIPSFQKGNANVEVTTEGARIVTNGNPTLFTEVTPKGIGLGVKVNSPVNVEEKGYSANLGYSANMSIDWAGNGVVDSIWNSTLTFDLNHVDMDVSTGTEGFTKANLTDGVYLKFKPAQVVTVTAFVVVVAFTPVDELIAMGTSAWLIWKEAVQEAAKQVIPLFMPGFGS